MNDLRNRLPCSYCGMVGYHVLAIRWDEPNHPESLCPQAANWYKYGPEPWVDCRECGIIMPAAEPTQEAVA